MTTTGPFTTNEIESLMPNYGAQVVGIKENDKVIKINDKKIKNKQDITETMQNLNGEEITVIIERNGEKIKFKLKPTEVKYKETGIYLKSDSFTKIVAIEPDSPAEDVGLEVNDVILKVEGQDVKDDTQKLTNIIELDEDGKLEFIIERNGEEKEFTVIANENSAYFLGVNLKQAENTFSNCIYYAFNKTVDFAFSIVENLKQLVTGKVATNQLMGPVGISSVVSDTEGIKEYIYILALISLSLGVTNLLPFPPLDGGKIVLLLIEAFRRKPLTEKVEMSIQMLGFTILIALSIYITYNDVLRIF